MLKYETLLFVSGSATVALSRALSLSLSLSSTSWCLECLPSSKWRWRLYPLPFTEFRLISRSLDRLKIWKRLALSSLKKWHQHSHIPLRDIRIWYWHWVFYFFLNLLSIKPIFQGQLWRQLNPNLSIFLGGGANYFSRYCNFYFLKKSLISFWPNVVRRRNDINIVEKRNQQSRKRDER